MDLEGAVKDTKDFFVRETWEYRGSKSSAVVNGVKALVGIGLAYYFDNQILEVLFGGYGIIKGIQFAKDMWVYRKAGENED